MLTFLEKRLTKNAVPLRSFRILPSLVAGAMFCASCFSDVQAQTNGQELSHQTDQSRSNQYVAMMPMLFVNGQYVAPPIQVTAQSDHLLVNGLKLTPATEGDWTDYTLTDPEETTQDTVQRREGRFLAGEGGRMPRRRPQARRPLARRPPTLLERLLPIPSSFMRVGQQNPNLEANRDSTSVPKEKTKMETVAAYLEASLSDGSLVVAFDDLPIQILYNPSDRYTMFSAFLAKPASADQVEGFSSLAKTEPAKDQWRRWAFEYQPDENLTLLMQSLVDELDHLEKMRVEHTEANHRMQTLAYPLTLTAMVLGVIAFGLMLQWMARGGFKETDSASDEITSYATKAILLMFGMSVVDLTWTILAVQAGVMSEVNPIAGSFVSNPNHLALFKLIATGSALAIFYFWRHRQQVQQAIWWMCLVCVLLTFRWVVFDSVIQ